MSDPEAVGEMTWAAPPQLSWSAGQAHAYWIDGREKHIIWALEDGGLSGYNKIYHKLFDAAAEAPADQLTPPGKYLAEMMRAAKDSLGRTSEIVLFKQTRMRGGMVTKGGSGLFTVTLGPSGWPDPVPLIPPNSELLRRDQIACFDVVRAPSGDLFVAYGAWCMEPPQGYVGDQLRIVRRSPDGKLEAHVVAAGVHCSFGSGIRIASDSQSRPIVVYQGRPSDGRGNPPLYFLQTDGRECLAGAEIAGRSVHDLFDIAVDARGRTHVVWVEDDGSDAVMKHRWVEPAAR